jgi:hypothetical protein
MLTAPINVSALGANTVVAAVAGRRLRVLGFILDAAGVLTVTWQDGAANNLSGPLSLPANTPSLVAPIAPAVGGSPYYWMITAPGQSLVLNLSAATACGGIVIYDIA